ncbi:hypothetical protein CHLRE_16g691888v5 [Chlamydomonas reinhardtii]|uniref:6-phosphofructo-2-kinase domain-containing protein n=1 Tax=Chlamydomonas reinhardtii TaxID=3055 RepID=A0A2K3CWB4_CHLRE|nr:uncharacterized protein CHLRE_16g691888v5 [Chlamydomonas reinhardtii]PNW72565.1 hypothetical protein CHLRE_16g691888v5 [Chlamydomonas reinhardtii]
MEHLKHGLQGGGLVPQASLDSAAPTRGQADGGDLARRSAPAPGLCLSSPNTQRNLGPSAHGPIHAPSGRGFASPLPTSAELSRRLRGLLNTSHPVNFRDVELMPPTCADTERGLGLEEADEADADAATGLASAPSGSAVTGAVEALAAAGPLGSSGGAGGTTVCEGEGAGAGPGAAVGGARARGGGTVVRKNKLIIIMVGLPGRGKTFLCNKIVHYLNVTTHTTTVSYAQWLGHATRHFNVGAYRRIQKGAHEVQSAAFFDHTNEAGMEARNRALNAALDDLMSWLRSDSGQVAVFDATNTTESRRNLLRSKFHGQFQYLFIETICSDPAVLEQNYRNKMKYSPDYKGVDVDQAVADFLARIAKYEEVYEPIADRNLHYIKLTDMVTGRGYMDINRISGYLPGKIVFFLMQVARPGLTSVRKIFLTRHGESQYNQKGLIGGNSSLSERGEKYARALPGALLERLSVDTQDEPLSVAVWTSTLKRTIETARSLPFPKLRWKALDEINAGICDGMTYEGIADKYPDEAAARKRDKLRYRYPAGESYMDVIQRVEPVIIELERERETVVVVAHQAVLRAVYAYFMNVPPEDIPRLAMPLHTLIELTPMPDGTMGEQRFPVDIDAVPPPPPVAELAAELVSGGSGVELLAGSAPSTALPASSGSPRSSRHSGAALQDCVTDGDACLPLAPASPEPTAAGDAEAAPVGALPVS